MILIIHVTIHAVCFGEIGELPAINQYEIEVRHAIFFSQIYFTQ